MISLADAETRNEELRLNEIYDLLDFNKGSQISKDELVGDSFKAHTTYLFYMLPDDFIYTFYDVHIFFS